MLHYSYFLRCLIHSLLHIQEYCFPAHDEYFYFPVDLMYILRYLDGSVWHSLFQALSQWGRGDDWKAGRDERRARSGGERGDQTPARSKSRAAFRSSPRPQWPRAWNRLRMTFLCYWRSWRWSKFGDKLRGVWHMQTAECRLQTLQGTSDRRL